MGAMLVQSNGPVERAAKSLSDTQMRCAKMENWLLTERLKEK